MPRKKRAIQRAVKPSAASGATESRTLGHPVFGQPQPTPDPTTFVVKHLSDAVEYKKIDALNAAHKVQPLGFDPPRGLPEPVLTMQQVLGGDKAAAAQVGAIKRQLVFHALGDCGSTRGPTTQNEVVDKLLSDFHEADTAEMPQFNLLLGDIVYSFGEARYYYDQFYEPYRDYHAPILAVAGNHDGIVAPDIHVKSLKAFLDNFCAQQFEVRPEAGGLSRTAQIQPGVFFTFEAPFVRIICLYSNMLEDPGVIQDKQHVGQSQIAFLKAALSRVKREQFIGALIFAHHHPAYAAASSKHGWSVQMLADMDRVCNEIGVWPHAVLAGHVHNYQRFTRYRGAMEIPYVSCGNGGHNVQRLRRAGGTLRVPQIAQHAAPGVDKIVFENYDDQNYGYLRVVVSASQLRIEYHPAKDGPDTKAPDDSVTVDLASHKRTPFNAPDLGIPAAAKKIRRMRG